MGLPRSNSAQPAREGGSDDSMNYQNAKRKRLTIVPAEVISITIRYNR
jgi:hypothetical protein